VTSRLSVLFAAALSITACSKGDDSPDSKGSDPSKSAPPAAARIPDPHPDPAAPDSFRVAFKTGKGDFVVEVHRAWSPRGVDRFHALVTSGYLDKVKFFRVIPDFIAQFGISGDPAKNQEWANTNIPDDSVKASNTRGTITFATAGPHTRTTQLFINTRDNVRLDQIGFSPFGKVVSGLSVVEKLNSEYGETPDQPMIEQQGNAYLNKNFPKLDSIISARVIK
jgi:peptidyl-prolyl cis-trans isomerase A (cyclophilin A)